MDSMWTKIRNIASKVIHDAQDDFIVDKKHNPSQGTRANELADKVLALPTEGWKVIELEEEGTLQEVSHVATIAEVLDGKAVRS